MTSDPLSVTCIGLGRIGSGIAQSILRAGHRLTVYNRTPEKMRTLAASGAILSGSPSEAAASADIVLTCPDGRRFRARESHRPQWHLGRHAS
jgi:3-hydroxyisobutyrate dehydrogenase-like beta-hydroxyacid dehydrogenase